MTARTSRAKTGLWMAAALVVGSFLVLYATLGLSSWELGRQRQALESETAVLARSARTRTVADHQDRLQAAQGRLESAANLFPEQLKVSQALETILTVASRSDVRLLGLQEKAPIREVVGTHVYYTWPFTLRAQGSVEQLLRLVTRLERGEGGPLVLHKVGLTRNKEDYTASVDLAFYTRSRTETAPKPEIPVRGKQGRAPQ